MNGKNCSILQCSCRGNLRRRLSSLYSQRDIRDNIHAYISQLEKENIALLKKIEILKNIINH